jgi:Fe-S cluster assembly protein SufD
MIEAPERSGTYLEEFERFAAEAAPALLETRRAAIDRFVALGFPTMRHEDWKFTNVGPIASTAFRRATADGVAVTEADLADETFAREGWPRLVFVNGHFARRLSSPAPAPAPGTGPARLEPLGAMLAREPRLVETRLAGGASVQENPFIALNTAFMQDGAVVHVPRNAVLAAPIHLLFVTVPGADPLACHPRSIIVLEEGSKATIVETYLGLGEGAYFSNAVTQITVGDNAVLDHYKVVREGASGYHVGMTHLRTGRDSSATSYNATLGGRLVRNNITAVLDGPGGHCMLNGLYVGGNRQHIDNHLRVEHAKPHCDSREFFKGILDGHAHGVFSGRIVVHKDAQKTDAKQTNMNLLLSEDAQIDTKPQLEIFADDVKCTHGATIGQVDEDAVFYLAARGIDLAAARAMLVFAFAGESLDRVQPVPLRKRLRAEVLSRLPHGDLLREAL